MPCSFLRPAALACALPLALATFAAGAQSSAQGFGHGNGKLLLTGGVSSIDGAAGGGLTPWAVTGSYATEGQVGATAFLTRATLKDYALTGYGVAVGLQDRFEASIARQEFDVGVVVPGTRLKLDIVGLKARVWGDAVFDSDKLVPQIAVGAQFKHVNPGPAVGGILDGAGVKRDGIDLSLRATKANQNGLLGFGSSDKGGYHLEPEFSVAYMFTRNFVAGAEYRFKPNNLAFAGAPFAEDDWKDIFVAWAPSKHFSLTAAYVDLGNIVGHKKQTGAYLSAQLAF